jgi:hypothetical protein
MLELFLAAVFLLAQAARMMLEERALVWDFSEYRGLAVGGEQS